MLKLCIILISTSFLIYLITVVCLVLLFRADTQRYIKMIYAKDYQEFMQNENEVVRNKKYKSLSQKQNDKMLKSREE